MLKPGLCPSFGSAWERWGGTGGGKQPGLPREALGASNVDYPDLGGLSWAPELLWDGKDWGWQK